MNLKNRCLFILILLALFSYSALSFSGGSGTGSDPYQVSTCQELQEMSPNHGSSGGLSDNYILISDIDCSSTQSWNSGKGFDPVGAGGGISGYFNGSGYTISGLHIDRPSEGEVALFGALDGGQVTNVSLVESSITGDALVGSLVGYVKGAGGNISFAFSNANVTSKNTNQPFSGGMVGYGSDNTFVNHTYFLGKYEGSINIHSGHFSSTIYPTAENSYSADCDGVTAWIEDGYTEIDTYFGDGCFGGGTSAQRLDTSKMKGDSASANMNFDFNNKWQEVKQSDVDSSADGYPVLRNLDRKAQLEAQGIYDPFSGGNGTSSNPYKISTCKELEEIDPTVGIMRVTSQLSANYELINDIDCSGSGSWNSGKGFHPIGTSNYFTGVLNGNNYTINHLEMDRNSDQIGLFGFLDGEVKYLGVEDMNITNSARSDTGGIAGRMEGGTIKKSYTDGVIDAREFVGGVVGYHRGGTIKQSFSIAKVSGEDAVGGLVGLGSSDIEDSWAGGDVSSISSPGGLVGFIQGTISNSYSYSTVSGDGTDDGLVGDNFGTVSDSYWDTVTSGHSSSSGGTGLTEYQMTNSSASNNMNFDFTNTWSETHSYPRHQWWKPGDGSTSNPYKVFDCHNLEDLNKSLTMHYEIVRDIDCSESENWWGGSGFKSIGEGSGVNLEEFRGTLDGRNHTVDQIYVDRSEIFEGALFGEMERSGAKVSNLGLTNVDITSNSGYAASIVGILDRGTVSNTFATGQVSGGSSLGEGGLVGTNADGTITESYASVDVSSSGDRVGGLVGSNKGSVKNSYSVGSVSGSSDVGGLIGYKSGATVQDSYWDNQTSGQSSSAGGTGLTTSEMQGSACGMEGFGESAWDYFSGGYPDLEPFSATGIHRTCPVFEVNITDFNKPVVGEDLEVEIEVENTGITDGIEDIHLNITGLGNSSGPMVGSQGNTVKYSYTGSKEEINLSNRKGIYINNISGAGGGTTSDSASGGSGGYVENVSLDARQASHIDLWVGGTASGLTGGWGRYFGGNGGSDYYGPGGAGSTEISFPNGDIIAGAGGGAGGGVPIGTGGGGARGGSGGGGGSPPPQGGDGGDGSDNDGGSGDGYVNDELGNVAGGLAKKGMGKSQNTDGEVFITFSAGLNVGRTENINLSVSTSTGDGGTYTANASINEDFDTKCVSVDGTKIRSQSTAAAEGKFWMKGDSFRWSNSSHKLWLNGANIVDGSSSGPAGSVWVEGTDFHWIDDNGNERSFTGNKEGSAGGDKGSTWVEDGMIHYIDQNSDKREVDGIVEYTC
jgi:hypothetical protein